MSAHLRIVVAPDAFVGLLTALEVAQAVAAGWATAAPADDLHLVTLSDGGPGFAAVMSRCAGTATPTVYVDGADAVDARGGSAQLGRRIAVAVATGASRIVVGVAGVAGGLASRSDGGYGALLALGALERSGGGGELALAPALARLSGAELVIATDVDDTAGAVPSWLPPAARPLAGRDGAGAQGGLGLALLALGATRVNASQLTIDAAGLADLIAGPIAGQGVADLVITGERVVGWHSRRGRVLAGVARTAVTYGAPVVALCADVQIGRRETANLGLEAVYALAPALAASTSAGPTSAGPMVDAVSATAARVARTWSRPDLR